MIRTAALVPVFQEQPFDSMRMCVHQVTERHSISLGSDADRLYKYPHVLPGVAMDACCLPAFIPTRPSAGQSGTACRERTPLHHVSYITGNG